MLCTWHLTGICRGLREAGISFLLEQNSLQSIMLISYIDKYLRKKVNISLGSETIGNCHVIL